MDDYSSPRTLSPTALAKMKLVQKEGLETGRKQALIDSPIRQSLVKLFRA